MLRHGHRPILAGILLLCTTAMPAGAADLYRVELLMFERRLGAPEELPERYNPVPMPERGVPLWVNGDWQPSKPLETDDDNGTAGTPVEQTPDILALPPGELRLDGIARSLQKDSGYRILAFTGWQNPFPDGYRTVPMAVDLAVDEEGKRRIQGSLQIRRQRYLHLDASLYETRLREPRFDVAPIPRFPLVSGLIHPLPAYLAPESPAFRETVTWLRQNRRMRSEEVHYLDAPTFGLVVYFHPITKDDEDGENGE